MGLRIDVALRPAGLDFASGGAPRRILKDPICVGQGPLVRGFVPWRNGGQSAREGEQKSKEVATECGCIGHGFRECDAGSVRGVARLGRPERARRPLASDPSAGLTLSAWRVPKCPELRITAGKLFWGAAILAAHQRCSPRFGLAWMQSMDLPGRKTESPETAGCSSYDLPPQAVDGLRPGQSRSPNAVCPSAIRLVSIQARLCR